MMFYDNNRKTTNTVAVHMFMCVSMYINVREYSHGLKYVYAHAYVIVCRCV